MGFGLAALAIWIVVGVGGFVLSAWLVSLYVRLVIRFMRKSLDREYRYMRGNYAPAPSPSSGQNNNGRGW
jgi:hypothetical protein